MADQSNQVRRPMLSIDLPNSVNSIGGFRPLPSQPGATSERLGAAAGTNRPKMSLPTISKSTVDPTIDRTRFGPSERNKQQRDSRFKICQSMNSSGKLQIGGKTYDFTSDDLQDIGEIGRGGFGTVNKMVHRKSGTVVAVKRIRSTVDEKEQKQLLMDLDVVMKSNECHYIVQFYGALFKEGDCWIVMELMDTSLDKFYKFIYDKLGDRIPEEILGKIALATVKALNYLKEKLKIIHRDVKPSNILLDRKGNIKLCDFGISGQLVDSIARTRDAGCRPYMAPERIDPQTAKGYDVRSDVWSLGITLMEVATGRFPYPRWSSVFDQLHQVVNGEPPRLTENHNANTFTSEFVNFVNTCLIKDEHSRPKYKRLLEDPFILRAQKEKVDVAAYVSRIMDEMANNGISAFTTNQQ
ncbi:dual specificity mitogen-activated protein kinase kinase 4 isoform X2 [Tribolium castaneum]|uniref:mitogen-activated protein kinase kinase n=1 Tax=Tribolium castaneum TaxID=7070 RepID=D6WXT4_TRICA|nr:PREDICTED: dual specificity mitogen-activated protein kinase kinase 4 isoform X3 [Tribolium castaneum]EFA07934.2 Dual specificity mitogen-activated protein kinase kinase hemipterous-like Protein [Tribolium castaneum]|eukprot:XP_974082.2 PREDICTED: dual specificity mitogen-activated protein kinase kinase 4 isoform X3 [Tribolium castaneum]